MTPFIVIFLLITNATILGLRHGLELDHIAAIMDIVGTTSTASSTKKEDPSLVRKRSLFLSFLYAFGHSAVVIVLGSLAIVWSTSLPHWVDPIMEKIVGVSLLVFGFGVLYVLYRSKNNGTHFHYQSRWMFLIAATKKLFSKITGKKQSEQSKIIKYGPGTAFGVGVVHGIGVETGTQVALLASATGITNHIVSVCMLFAFVIGIFFSNTVVAWLGSTGFLCSRTVKPLYVTTAIAAASFSLIIGTMLILGKGNTLPNLNHLIALVPPADILKLQLTAQHNLVLP